MDRARRQLTGLMAADLVSTTGTEMTAVALPWFVLVTTGSPARTGLVLAAEFTGLVLLGLPSGRVVQSLGSRRTMLLADGSRAGLVALVPLLHALGILTFPLLVAVAFTVGAFFTSYQAAQRLALTAVVGDDELSMTRVGGLLSAANESASFVGPALGGVLVVLVGATNVLLLDAVSYLAAFVLVAAALPHRQATRGEATRGEADGSVRLLDGLQYLGREPSLRAWTAGLCVIQVSFAALIVALPVLARGRYNAGAALAGGLLASYGLGSVIGGLISARARRSTTRLPLLALCAMAGVLWPLVLGPPAWVVAGCITAHGICSGIVYPRYFAAVAVRPPRELRAHVLTAATTVLSATAPIGFVAGGLLLDRSAGPTACLLLVAASATVGVVLTLVLRDSRNVMG